ncbi:MAG: DNA-binding protein WhiA [Lachnospiraceae bacterium]|nr:DNA-binding protein WhiA [Lachnospiraceae bacterium]
MSFSSNVKEELSRQSTSARHCIIAEIAAIVSMCGRIQISAENKLSVKINTENIDVARKYFGLVRKAFNICPEISIRQNTYLRNSRTYTITVNDHNDALRILMAVKLTDDGLEISENLSIMNNVITKNVCCKRAFLRGAFLATGSISDPEKSYHLEIVCATMEKAEQIKNIIASFDDIDAKIVERKKHFVVYVKEGAGIVEMLNVMEAHVALMELENIRILKDMRNSVNRKVNCEAANINKTVGAAMKQINDINLIKEVKGLEWLPEQLYEISVLRLDNPDVSLIELGTMLSTPVGKSGVNHRFRRIGEIADTLRQSHYDN